jgi:hypothetical protein
MHTDPLRNKKPTGSVNYPAGHTDRSILPAGKAFATLAAQYALCGHTLTRSCTPDGGISYQAVRWGLSRSMPDMHLATEFLAQIGGVK